MSSLLEHPAPEPPLRAKGPAAMPSAGSDQRRAAESLSGWRCGSRGTGHRRRALPGRTRVALSGSYGLGLREAPLRARRLHV